MEITVVVLLLLCAVSSADESEEAEERPRPYPLGLHAELRDMRVELTENKFKIQQLQKENKELEAKLKALEDQDGLLKPIKEQLEAQEAKLKVLEALASQVHAVKVQQNGQAAIVKKLVKQSSEITTIKEQLQVPQVAFFATYIESGSQYVGKYSTPTLLIFRNVIINIGDGYSPNTGFFTAPVSGAYRFDFTIYAKLDGSNPAGAVLRKNGKDIVVTYTYQSNGSASSGNGATLLLEADDVVSVHLIANTRIYDNDSHHCTFSGHLLFVRNNIDTTLPL